MLSSPSRQICPPPHVHAPQCSQIKPSIILKYDTSFLWHWTCPSTVTPSQLSGTFECQVYGPSLQFPNWHDSSFSSSPKALGICSKRLQYLLFLLYKEYGHSSVHCCNYLFIVCLFHLIQTFSLFLHSLNNFHVEWLCVLFFWCSLFKYVSIFDIFCVSFCLHFYCCLLLLKSALEGTSLEYRFLSFMELFPEDKTLEVEQSAWTVYDSYGPAAFQRCV